MTDPVEWRQFDVALCRIKSRPLYMGQPVRESVARQEGAEVLLQALWQCDDDERYPGEWALSFLPSDGGLAAMITSFGTGWIASGDVEVLTPPERSMR